MGFAGSDKNGDDDKVGERAGTFKRGDIYKMYAYRDAIPDARSVWILWVLDDLIGRTTLDWAAEPGASRNRGGAGRGGGGTQWRLLLPLGRL